MRKLILLETMSDGQMVEHPIEPLCAIEARAGARYSVMAADGGEVSEGLVLRRAGDMLVVEVEGAPVARIDDFYGDDTAGALFLLPGGAGEDVVIRGGDGADVADGAVVWAADGESAGAGGWLWAGAVVAAGGLMAASASDDDGNTASDTVDGADGDTSDAGDTDAGDTGADAADTTAPTLSSASPSDGATDVAVGSDITLTFSEEIALGDAGTITIVNDETGDEIEIDVSDHGGQLSVAGDTLTIDPTDSLTSCTSYHVEVSEGAIEDLSGNDYAGIDDADTLNFDTGAITVVFDLVEGVSSDHSDRTFSADETYIIYIRVDSDSKTLSNDGSSSTNAGATWGLWENAAALGADDTVILVGNDGGGVYNSNGNYVTSCLAYSTIIFWQTGSTQAAQLTNGGSFVRLATYWDRSTLDLWTDTLAVTLRGPQSGGQDVLGTMPAGILTSQGLA